MNRKLTYAVAGVAIAVVAVGAIALLMNGVFFVGVPSVAALADSQPEVWIDNPPDGGRVPAGEAVAIRWRAFQPVNLLSFDVLVDGEIIERVTNQDRTQPFAIEEVYWYPPDTASYEIEVHARDLQSEVIRTAKASVTAHTAQPLFAGVDVDHTIKNPMYVQVHPAFPIQDVEVCRNVTLRWTTDWRGDNYSMRIWSIDKPGAGFSIYNTADPFLSVVLEPDATYQWTVWSKVDVAVSEDSRVIETFRTSGDGFCPSWKNNRVRAEILATEPTGQSAQQLERYEMIHGDGSQSNFPTGLAIGGGIALVAVVLIAFPLTNFIRGLATETAGANSEPIAVKSRPIVAARPAKSPASNIASKPASTREPLEINLRKLITVERLVRLNERLDLAAILFLFWAIFWVLNGGDKFFNGTTVPNTDDWSRSAAITTESGEIEYYLHPVETRGYFGVTRNAQMINFFSQLGWPAWSALVFLYGVALLELSLGVTFVVLFVRKFLLIKDEEGTLFGAGVLPHLAFKGAALEFAMFTFGDILFGDRTELWQHATYFSVVLVSYYLFTQHQKEQASQSIERGGG